MEINDAQIKQLAGHLADQMAEYQRELVALIPEVQRVAAQAGFDAAVRYYRSTGQLVDANQLVTIKEIVRDEKGAITALVEAKAIDRGRRK